MTQIEWTSELETGIDEVDEQHKALVAIYNKLDEAMRTGRGHKTMGEILVALVSYTAEHFEQEEQLMADDGYPELESHRSEHRQLLDKVNRFQKRLASGQERINKPVMKFLNFWLMNHIKASDCAYGLYAANRNAEEPAEV